MSINIGPAASDDMRPRIAVIGVGGAGGNAIANMLAAEIEVVDYVFANTEAHFARECARRAQRDFHATQPAPAAAR